MTQPAYIDEYGGDSRPPVYWDESVGKWVFRAYSMGNCIRSLAAFKRGITPGDHPDWLLKAFAEGHINEPIILSMLYDPARGHPWRPVDGGAQQTVEIPVGEEAIIRGHNDDVAWAELRDSNKPSNREPGEVRVVEAKAFVQSTYDKWLEHGWDAFPYYRMQNAIYMHAFQKKLLWVVGIKDPKTREVVRIHVHEIDEPPASIVQIKMKVMDILRAEALPGCDFKQYPCQMFMIGDENGCGGAEGQKFFKGHTEEESATYEQLRRSVAIEQLNNPAEMWMRGQRMAAEGQGLMRQAYEQVEEWVKCNSELLVDGNGEFKTKDWNVTIEGNRLGVKPKREVERHQ